MEYIRTLNLQKKGQVPVMEEVIEYVAYDKIIMGDSLGEKINWYFDEDNMVAIMTSCKFDEYTYIETLNKKERPTLPEQIRNTLYELKKGDLLIQYCRDPENNTAYIMTEEVFFKLVDKKNGLVN